jgi:hypothetical protein
MLNMGYRSVVNPGLALAIRTEFRRKRGTRYDGNKPLTAAVVIRARHESGYFQGDITATLVCEEINCRARLYSEWCRIVGQQRIFLSPGRTVVKRYARLIAPVHKERHVGQLPGELHRITCEDGEK